MTVTAPAKVNLWLEVTGRRPDGYHMLDSAFAFADFGDRLEFQRRATPGIGLSLTGPEADLLLTAGPLGDNLVIRAAHILAAAAGRTVADLPGVQITLEKTLPVASGIGGGSADAAATLRALRSLWGLDLPADEMEKAALCLGADVPAALYSRPLYVRGIGEKLTPVSLVQTFGLLLVNPRTPVSTRAVFGSLSLKDRKADSAAAPPDKAPLTLAMIRARSNHLSDPARALCPAIETVLSVLRETSPAPALVRMSGSGATCFALYVEAGEAKAAAAQVKSRYPHWWVASGILADHGGFAGPQAPAL